MAKNVNIEVLPNGKMLIEVDLNLAFGPSKSGKTNIIASTEGNKKVEMVNGGVAFVGLNVYKKAD